MRLSVLALLIAAFAACRSSSTQLRPIPPEFVPFASYRNGETALYGYVLDSLRAPVETVQVSIGARYRTYSDSTGRYALRVPAVTRQIVKVARIGFVDDSVSIEVGDAPHRLDFILHALCAQRVANCVVRLPDGRHVLEACHC